MAVMGSMFAISSVAGPLLGGWFTNGPGWRWAFWINVPVAAARHRRRRRAAASGAEAEPVPDGRGRRPRMVVAVTALVLVTGTPPASLAAAGRDRPDRDRRRRLDRLPAIERRAKEPIIPLRMLRHRDFVLATAGGLCFSLAMTGVVGYLPTYLQMATGLTATTAGLMMIPMVLGIMTSSFGCGTLISRTGHYAWMPVAGAAVVAASVLALASCRWPAAVGARGRALHDRRRDGARRPGAHPHHPVRLPPEVGTATANYTFFKEIGASLGASVIGGIFAARLATNLAASPALGVDPHSLTPQAVAAASAPVRAQIAADYHDALIPVYLGLVPMMIAAGVWLLFIREQHLPSRATMPAGGAAERLARAGEEAVSR